MLIAVIVLPGCMNDMGDGIVSRFKGATPFAVAASDDGAQPAVARTSDASDIIAALQSRTSVLIPGTPYSQIAQAVIASDARVAEAELRVARLRAEAAQKNWLPTIGPSISLTSLGDFVADLVVNQVLFDNGRKVAERDLAKADVEIAAVNLVDDGNTRVYEALSLYLRSEENRQRAAQLASAIRDMNHFEWVMNERVNGGVSDRSDLNIIRQKLASMRARESEANETVATAMAELNAMSSIPLNNLRGIGGLQEVVSGEALGVIRARAERDQAIAQAKIARASHLPGLAATGSVGQSKPKVGLEVTTDQLFGLGSMAQLEAIDATKETADRKVDEAHEDAAREIASQTRKFEAYRRQSIEAEALTTQASRNLDLFQAQYEGGQRQVMDVVGVYETYARAVENEIDLKYKAARAELDLARLRGALAEGAQI
jgi:adhesin transport system outer membrane protein